MIITQLFLLITLFSLFTETFTFRYSKKDKFQLTVKGNYKLYLNKKYIGLQSNELKALLDIQSVRTDGVSIKGIIYHFNKAVRDSIQIGQTLNEDEETSFVLHPNGVIDYQNDSTFPPLSSIPYFPEKEIRINEIYENYGRVFIILHNTQKKEAVTVKVTTQYVGLTPYLGHEYETFKISYQFQYPENRDTIKKVRGRHNLELYFDNTHGKPVFMKDQFLEEFEMANGDIIKRDGFNLYFYKVIIPLDRKEYIASLEEQLDKEINDKNIVIAEKEHGISLTLNDINFMPNSTRLVSGEEAKLKTLADTLKKIEGRSFLVIGHTALSGTEEERMRLSTERAQTIAAFLIQQGIPAQRILFQGKGAKDPVAPNDTEENMKKNRRVEIIILED